MTAHFQPRGDVAVLVPAAGAGVRLGPGAPKALRQLGGVPLLIHAVRRLAAAPSAGVVVVAAPPADLDAVRTLLGPLTSSLALTRSEVIVVAGGNTRQQSVAAALAAVPAGPEIILVHDAARALVPPALVESVAAAVRGGADAVVPVLPVVDTIKEVSTDGQVLGTVDRSALRAVQTPQGFRRAVLTSAHANATDALTDDAGLVEKLGLRVTCVPGSERALKITRPFDLVIAEHLLGTEAEPRILPE